MSSEARFRFPFNRQLERRPAQFNLPSLSTSQRAASYENINLNRHPSSIHSSSASSSNTIHRSSSSLNAANSPAIMMESAAAATHQGAASILNGMRANNQARRIPQFILRHRDQLKMTGKIIEKSGIALAAVGGMIQIKDAVSSDANDRKKIDEAVSIDSESPGVEREIDIAIATSTTAVSTTATSTDASTTESYNPIGHNK